LHGKRIEGANLDAARISIDERERLPARNQGGRLAGKPLDLPIR
jgi:hypothetical protein